LCLPWFGATKQPVTNKAQAASKQAKRLKESFCFMRKSFRRRKMKKYIYYEELFFVLVIHYTFKM